MKQFKYLIIGAGPSGLTLANSLISFGVSKEDICLLEKEKIAGGLCRSDFVDGAPLDIGGGHFLDLKNQEVLEFLFQFMPRDEWTLHERVAKIRLRGFEVDHPLEANLWQFPIDIQLDFLESIAQAGSACGVPIPSTFSAWIRWKLGELIAEEYMLPYNRKLFGINLDQLGTYWLEKLPNVSLRETLKSSLEGSPNGKLPAHGSFLYPNKYGFGEVWLRMGARLGDSLVTGYTINSIDLKTLTINNEFRGHVMINTIPWTLWPNFAELPVDTLNAIEKLKYTSIDVDYQPVTLESNAHWIYDPSESLAYHRLLLRSNFTKSARGYWTETNSIRSPFSNGIRFHNKFAYPVNTIEKPIAINDILLWAKKLSIHGLGRWGRWEHMNSDVAVAEAIRMAKLLAESKKF